MADDTLFLGIDQSTQGSKALLFDSLGHMLCSKSMPHRQIVNDKGYVEHDLKEIAHNVIDIVKQLVSSDPTYKTRIASVGLSVQRETVGAWNKKTLEPVYNAIVWQCARGADYVNTPKVQSYKDAIRQLTGLELSEYFSAPKITWLADNVPAFNELAKKGELCVGNMDAFLVSILTHGESFKTEPSNASRTMLMNLKELCFDEKLCELFKVPIDALPQIVDSDALFGMTDFDGVLDHKIPIHAAMGDSQAALFGHGCLKEGQVKATYGTGSSIMMNSGSAPGTCEKGIVNSAGFKYKGKVTYVLEGNINYSAGIISYLKDDLKLISSPKETEELCCSANPNDTCVFVPALSGLGAPYFTANVRGTIVGMSRLTGRNELVRAAVDSIALQVNDVLDLIRKSSSVEVTKLCVDGGATANGYLMQLQSDLSMIPVEVPENPELSGSGAAFMAAIASGICDESVLHADGECKTYTAKACLDAVKLKKELWHKAVNTAIGHGL